MQEKVKRYNAFVDTEYFRNVKEASKKKPTVLNTDIIYKLD